MPTRLSFVLPLALCGCIVVPLPQEAAEKLPFAVPITLGAGAADPAAPLPGPRCPRPERALADSRAALAAVNRVRAAEGLAPVRHNARLDVAAQDQACVVAAAQAAGHRGADGAGLGRRVAATGYGWRNVAENVGFGSVASADEMVARWQASAGHRRTMLGRAATEAGFGYAETQGGRPGWALILAAPR